MVSPHNLYCLIPGLEFAHQLMASHLQCMHSILKTEYSLLTPSPHLLRKLKLLSQSLHLNPKSLPHSLCILQTHSHCIQITLTLPLLNKHLKLQIEYPLFQHLLLLVLTHQDIDHLCVLLFQHLLEPTLSPALPALPLCPLKLATPQDTTLFKATVTVPIHQRDDIPLEIVEVSALQSLSELLSADHRDSLFVLGPHPAVLEVQFAKWLGGLQVLGNEFGGDEGCRELLPRGGFGRGERGWVSRGIRGLDWLVVLDSDDFFEEPVREGVGGAQAGLAVPDFGLAPDHILLSILMIAHDKYNTTGYCPILNTH